MAPAFAGERQAACISRISITPSPSPTPPLPHGCAPLPRVDARAAPATAPADAAAAFASASPRTRFSLPFGKTIYISVYIYKQREREREREFGKSNTFFQAFALPVAGCAKRAFVATVATVPTVPTLPLYSKPASGWRAARKHQGLGLGSALALASSCFRGRPPGRFGCSSAKWHALSVMRSHADSVRQCHVYEAPSY
jgi:hypothetical protein